MKFERYKHNLYDMKENILYLYGCSALYVSMVWDSQVYVHSLLGRPDLSATINAMTLT